MHELICGCRTCGFICPEHAADRIGGCARCAHFARVFDALKIMLDGNTDKRMVSGRENPSGDKTMTKTPKITFEPKTDAEALALLRWMFGPQVPAFKSSKKEVAP